MLLEAFFELHHRHQSLPQSFKSIDIIIVPPYRGYAELHRCLMADYFMDSSASSILGLAENKSVISGMKYVSCH